MTRKLKDCWVLRAAFSRGERADHWMRPSSVKVVMRVCGEEEGGFVEVEEGWVECGLGLRVRDGRAEWARRIREVFGRERW